MKKIPRITINRIELCKQPKSGAFRTAILITPFHRMSSVFGFGSPAAKNIQQIVYKLNESHYEDLNPRHYLRCQTHLLQLFVMSGGASSSWKGGNRDFFKEQESHKVTFSFLHSSFPFYHPTSFLSSFPPSLPPIFLNQRQPDMYLLLKCTNLLKNKGFVSFFCFGLALREETWAGEVGGAH